MGIMSHIENRQHPRFPLRMPVLWESPAVRGYQKIGFTQNVSQGGLLLALPCFKPQDVIVRKSRKVP